MSFDEIRALHLGLHTFGNDLQTETEAHRDHRVDDRRGCVRGDDRPDKREIDLERVDRESLQPAEHRVPRAEVVDRDAHAEISNALQQVERFAVFGYGGALCDLELEQCWVEATLLQRAEDALEQPATGEAPAGDIHRYRDCANGGGRPLTSLATSGGEHPCI